MLNYIKRALLSIKRRPSKSILLFLVVFLLSNLMIMGYAIGQSTSKSKEMIKNNLGAEITIHSNAEMMLNNLSQEKRYDDQVDILNILESISKDEEISYVEYEYLSSFDSREIYNRRFTGVFDVIKNIDPIASVALHSANQSLFHDLKNENIEIVEGRSFTEEEIKEGKKVIILNQDYGKSNKPCLAAKENENEGWNVYRCIRDYENIHVGDSITLLRRFVKEGENYSKYNGFIYNSLLTAIFEEEVQYEVIGIFKYLSETRDNFFWPSVTNGTDVSYTSEILIDGYVPLNNMILEEQYMFDLYHKYPESVNYYTNHPSNYLRSISIKIKDPELVEDYTNKLKKIFKDNGYDQLTFITSADAYETIAGPLESVTTISRLITIISAIAAIGILILVVMLFLKDREHELNIYHALGEAKHKIIKQFIVEVYLVSILAIGCSFVSGSYLGEFIGNQMLDIQKNKQQEVMEDKLALIQSVSFDTSDMNSKIEMKMNAQIVIMMITLESAIVIFSTALPLNKALKK